MQLVRRGRSTELIQSPRMQGEGRKLRGQRRELPSPRANEQLAHMVASWIDTKHYISLVLETRTMRLGFTTGGIHQHSAWDLGQRTGNQQCAGIKHAPDTKQSFIRLGFKLTSKPPSPHTHRLDLSLPPSHQQLHCESWDSHCRQTTDSTMQDSARFYA